MESVWQVNDREKKTGDIISNEQEVERPNLDCKVDQGGILQTLQTRVDNFVTSYNYNLLYTLLSVWPQDLFLFVFFFI